MYKKILLTLDGSGLAEQAVEHAVILAQGFGTELFLLRVVEPIVRSYRGGSTPPSALQSVEQQLLKMAQEYLQGIAQKLQSEGLSTQVAARIGRADKEIMRFARANDIDMIVMCSCGEGGLARWLLGSVADHVVRAAPVPVLVVPPQRVSEPQ
jgi:nucleotide-binding universal stress UspA family protein